MYWHLLACVWYVTACIEFWFSTHGPWFSPRMHVLACIVVCIGMYWVRIFLYLNAIRADLNLDAYIVKSIGYVCGMYWCVLVCMGKNLRVLNHNLKMIADIPMRCHSALHSTFHATFTVDTPAMSLNWIFSPQDGQRERLWTKHQCEIFPRRFQSQAYPRIFIPSWVVLAQYG